MACTLLGIGFAWLGNTGERWVPILDGANLLFHEAGHPIAGIFSERLMVYGGTLGQLTFPLVAAVTFFRSRRPASLFVACAWLAQNGWNIARYMADARAQLLPLVGDGDRIHDWGEIFSRWGVLRFDTKIAGAVTFVAAVGLAAAWVWLYRHWRSARD